MGNDIPSDNTLSQSIKTQNAHLDKRSYEASTKKEKPKYKLVGKIIDLPPILLYPFFVLTTEKTACRSVLTLRVEKTDWENKHPLYLNAEYSYIDINKVEPLSKEDIIQKINDPENKFLFVGRLSDKKFKELLDKKRNLAKTRPIHEKHLALIQCALSEAEIPRKALENLSLN